MKVGNLTLNAFQTNFIKELMGDPFMTDVRAEAHLAKLSLKYDVDVAAMLTSANVKFKAKNDEFKKLEASGS